MNGLIVPPGSVAAATAVICGLLVAAFPEYALTVLQLGVVTVAVALALHALAVNVPEWGAVRWLLSPFNRRPAVRPAAERSDDLDRIRRGLSRRRQRIPGGPPLTPEALRVLKRLVRVALERRGVEPDRPDLSPLTRAILESEPLGWRGWYGTLRPDEKQVAEVVHHVLDDLERLGPDRDLPTHPSTPTTRGPT